MDRYKIKKKRKQQINAYTHYVLREGWNKIYSINNITLTNEILISCLENFRQEIFEPIKDDKHLIIQCKVNFSDNDQGYKSLTYFRKVNYGDKELFYDYLLQRLSILSDSYVTHPICQIIFSYIIKDGLY